MNLLTRWLPPVGSVGVVFGATWWAGTMGWIPEHVQYWLWPLLVALTFLGLSVLVFLRDARLWLWPLGTGFVVSLLGLALRLSDVESFTRGWVPFWYSLGSVGLVLMVMLTVWTVNYFRARMLERRMAEGMAEGMPGNEAELGRIRKDMMDALSLLRRAGRGKNAIYELPWFLVMGRPAAGKTVAVKNSGLSLPVRKDWVKGVGGTYTADWFFTNELIFLDTPGKWVTEGSDEASQKHWKTLLRLLRKFRGRRPLDGLVVVVPADDLLSKDYEELEEQAANVRDVVDLMHRELHFRFPIYLLVTKCDLVDGFVDFFRGVPSQRRDEILGWSNPDPNDGDAPGLIHRGFQRVQRRLEAYRLEMLGRIARRTQARRLFFFTEDFRALERPLTAFSDALFQSDRFHEPPVFRGFYFTSGTQGEGAPLSKAMSALARTLGVGESKTAGAVEEESKKSYFLLDLFRELMVGDEGLVGRTAGHWWKQRRNTLLGAFAPAGLALVVLLLSLISFAWNRNVYSGFANNAGEIVSELETLGARPLSETIDERLALTGRLRDYHTKMAGWSLFRSFGMRRPDAPTTRAANELFRREFSEAVLRPLLKQASDYALEGSCAARIETMHSVVYLGLGRQWERSTELEMIIEDQNTRRRLREQYKYYKDHRGGAAGGDLFPGFSLRTVARSISDNCADQGATSALEMYRAFQESCRQRENNAAVEECVATLNEILRFDQEEYARFVASFEQLKTDLAELQTDETEAQDALELLSRIQVFEQGQGKCLAQFAKRHIPEIRDFAESGDLLEECRADVDAAGDRGKKYLARQAAVKKLEEQLSAREAGVKELFRDFSLDCRDAVEGFRRLDFDLLRDVVLNGMAVRCMREPPANPVPETKPTILASRKATRSAPRPRRPDTQWVAAPRTFSGTAMRKEWVEKRDEWFGMLASLDAGLSEAQRTTQKSAIEAEIRSSARRYHDALIKYLEGLELRPHGGSPAAWLAELGATGEYKTLLQPVIDALEVQKDAAEPPFDVLADQLEPLAGLKVFATSGLQAYQDALRRVAQDLERCSDTDYFVRYRGGIGGDRNNSLFQAADWVSVNSPRLAEGKLRELLQAPIAKAREFVSSSSLLKSQWEDLSRLYADDISGRAPIAGLPGEAEPISKEALTALLGGKTGLVVAVRKSAREGGLDEPSTEWLRSAEALSEVFFEPGEDRLREIKAQLTIGEAAYEPENLSKKLPLRKVQIVFGPEDKWIWETDSPDDVATRWLGLNLFGDQSSDFAFVKGVTGERKGFVGRAVGANYKEGAPIAALAIEGVPFAALELLRRGSNGGSPDELQYTVEVPLRKDEVGKIVIPIRLSGDEVLRLLDLVDNPLGPPPAIAGS